MIDSRAIENLRSHSPGDDDEFLREIAALFLRDTPHLIADLDQSAMAGDVARFTRAAHSIKGSSAILGVVRLRAGAEKLELHARTQGLAGVASLVAQVKVEFGQAHAELTALIAK